MESAYNMSDTIYALSSGHGVGGVAVIRISGNQALAVFNQLAGLKEPKNRYAHYVVLKDGNRVLDHSLALYFKGPNSFTGEDVVELHVHGGRSVILSVLKALSNLPEFRPAEPGEFSRRAVVNGKMDLTEAEGLMDLIHATTEQQQTQALLQMDGALSKLYEDWRAHLIHDMAYLEAFIDFPEEDIPPEKQNEITGHIQELIQKINHHLDDGKRGQKLRDGFQIALIGAPNAGKSSLINALTQKEMAIVSTTAGTTRDVVEAYLDVDGFPVILADTAGLRETSEEIEQEGIRRAVKKATEADLIIHLIDSTQPADASSFLTGIQPDKILTVYNKSDITPISEQTLSVSAKTGQGIDVLWNQIKQILSSQMAVCDKAVITRERYRVALNECVVQLTQALNQTEIELKAENLRLAAKALGRITGRIEADELLDVIFRDFCIGK